MYIIDYFIKAEEALPPDKRTPRTVALAQSFVSEVADDHSLLFSTYKDYVLTPVWGAGSYNRRDLVRYGKSIFQSLIDSNTDEPTFTDSWRLVSSNFLGTDFRLKIRGEKLVLEYALNIWFDTVFRQPPLVSDIYLTTNSIISTPVFRIGEIEAISSNISTQTSSEFVVNNYTFAAQFNLDVNVPIAFYTALAATNDARTAIIRDFVNQYIPAGITYRVKTY